jgi:hypothetical protein
MQTLSAGAAAAIIQPSKILAELVLLTYSSLIWSGSPAIVIAMMAIGIFKPAEDARLSRCDRFRFRRVVLSLLLQAFSTLPYWENGSSISNISD